MINHKFRVKINININILDKIINTEAKTRCKLNDAFGTHIANI